VLQSTPCTKLDPYPLEEESVLEIISSSSGFSHGKAPRTSNNNNKRAKTVKDMTFKGQKTSLDEVCLNVAFSLR
jgi:hypothetical protein